MDYKDCSFQYNSPIIGAVVFFGVYGLIMMTGEPMVIEVLSYAKRLLKQL